MMACFWTKHHPISQFVTYFFTYLIPCIVIVSTAKLQSELGDIYCLMYGQAMYSHAIDIFWRIAWLDATADSATGKGWWPLSSQQGTLDGSLTLHINQVWDLARETGVIFSMLQNVDSTNRLAGLE